MRKEVGLQEKTVRSGAAKKPEPKCICTEYDGNMKKVFFIFI
jgi:hypothetical protein